MPCEIVVVRYNQPGLEKKCLDSIRKYTDLNLHKLNVVDNGKTDRNLGSLWNSLILQSDCEYICLLNSDTEVTADWLDKLIEAAEKEPLDAVGPMTNKCGIHFQLGHVAPGYQIRKTSTLSGFCLLLRKKAFLDAGGFREDFSFYGQESDLLDRMGNKAVRKDVFVYHAGGASIKATERFKEDKKLGMEQYRRNRKFDWHRKILVIGSPHSRFPLWWGISQAAKEFSRYGMEMEHWHIDKCKPVHFRKLIEWGPDCVIVANTNLGRLMKWKKFLRLVKVPRGLYFCDLRSAQAYCELKGCFDRVFLPYRNHGDEYGHAQWRVLLNAEPQYMPQGSVIWPQLGSNGRMRQDALFIGGIDENRFHWDRKEVVKKLKAKLVNKNGRDDRLKIELRTPEMYRSSRFVLSMSPAVDGYSSLRLYNVFAYGGLALVRWFPGIDELFVNGEHCLWWAKVGDAEELMKRYRNEKGECERIRKKGWRRQQVKHTMTWRLQNMIASLMTGDNSFWGYLK